jgi:uncharacterized membrane protein
MQNPPPGQQSYGTPYNAPPSPGGSGKSSTGLDPNVAALLSYVFGWVSGLIFFILEKENRFVRFHAMQSIFFNVLVAVGVIALWIVTFILVLVSSQLPDILGTLLGLVTSLIWLAFCVGLLIAWVMCLIRAYQGQIFKLPIIGNMAEKIVNK